MLENRAAELERLLKRAAADGDSPEYDAHEQMEFPAFAPPSASELYADSGRSRHDIDHYQDAATDEYLREAQDGPEAEAGGYAGAYARGNRAGRAVGGGRAGDRTEVLINRGRRHVRRGPSRWLAHWRAIVVVTVAVLAAVMVLSMVLTGGSPGWPASVATVQKQITIACQNPNVVSEPSQVNFACAKDTRQVLWVFSLLTSGDNPHFTDASNGRTGLEPIQPSQGGNIAWSLNLHHPYNPSSPIDSLQVAARAINNIIGGATVTGSNGKPVVQQGLESSPANCAKYTGSAALVARQGFPSVCALPLSSPDGQAALVSDVFRQWMVGAPAQFATEAAVLFANADNPGDPRVQSILTTLRTSGL
ncbi:MAG TPA: hypothetical protein VH589_30050 [Trebonia sp.]